MEERLLERDWRFVMDSVYQFYSMGSIYSFEQTVLECMSALIPATQTMIFQTTQDEYKNVVFLRCTSIGDPVRFMDEFLSGEYTEEPYFKRWGFFTDTKTFRDTDMMPEEYRTNTKIFKDIYAKQGIYYGLRSYLVHDGKAIGNICFFNSQEEGDFSARDLYVLDMIAPHIALKYGWLIAEAEKQDDRASLRNFLSKNGLTSREQEIALMVFSEQKDDEIADDLCISKTTFKKHIYNIYRKLGVNNRVQLFTTLYEANDRAKG